MIENETSWKQYREEMTKLIATLDYKEVWKGVDDKTSDEVLVGLPDAETLDNAQRFLRDMTSGHYFHMPHVYCDDRGVIIDWKTSSENRLEVQFRRNNEWLVVHEKNIVQTEGPEPSFWMECDDDQPKVPHFYLKDHLIKEIQREQVWSQTYEPMIHRKRIMWCTNYYDGPLAGYCTDSVGNDIYYFDCVEEQTFQPRARMCAVYELSPREQIDACVAHAKWIGTLKSPWRWWWYLFSFRLFRVWRFHINHEKRKEKWQAKHKLLGYFIN